MSELITISKTDEKFEKYLLGTFSKSHRALPVQSLNISTEAESVTFKVVPLSDIKQPTRTQWWSQILKTRNWLLVILPISMILFKIEMDQVSFDPILVLINTIGALLLLSALNLRNDFQDHYWGLDRVHPDVHAGPIQKGWMTADQVRKLSRLFLILGGMFGLPSLILFPDLLFFILFLSLLLVLATGLHQLGMKYRWGTEISAFLLPGPLLTVGFQISIGAGFDLESVWIGTLTGGLALFTLYLRHFEWMMPNAQVSFQNTMTRIGFEKGKRFLLALWFGWSLVFCIFRWVYGMSYWVWLWIAVLVFVGYRIFHELKIIQSPTGSSLHESLVKIRKMVWLVVAVWLLEHLSYLLAVELGSK